MLQGYQGTLNAFLLSPQAARLPFSCCVRPLTRFVAFVRTSGDRQTPPERPTTRDRQLTLRASRARAALQAVRQIERQTDPLCGAADTSEALLDESEKETPGRLTV